MSKIQTQSGDVFEMERDLIDVTSMHRPDVGWRFTDARGHLHQWFADGKPAVSYNPAETHDVPSLVWIKDGVGYYEDGEPYDIGHNECRKCGEHIAPAYTSDTCTQYVAGLARYYINGEPVQPDEFKRRAEAAIRH